MAPDGRLYGADRLVVYLPAATITLDALDGSREQAIRKETEKFLSSPESAFDKHPRDYIGHIRHIDTNTRAFATWCQNQTIDEELCVVHEIYQKKNEADYWADIDELNEQGSEFASGFNRLEPDTYPSWRSNIEGDDETIVVEESP